MEIWRKRPPYQSLKKSVSFTTFTEETTEKNRMANVVESGEGEPAAKKAKLQPEDPIFKSFDNDLKQKLNRCRTLISNSNLVFLKIICANAKSRVPFSKATCDTENIKWPGSNEEVNCMVEDLFLEGLDILDVYFNKHQIPEDPRYQSALAKFLKFFSEDHRPLFEDIPESKEGEWAIRLAQHLLSKLSVHGSYVIGRYPGCKFRCICPCRKHDALVGYCGDTSFGYKFGWHGETDIIIQEIPVSVHESAAEMKPKPDAKVSVNSIEVKNTPWFSLDNEAQMKAQTITFSPLQVKYNKTELRNCLIPGIGIGRRDVVAFFYDSEYDILLRSDDMALFLDQELTYSVVIFLWLTLNYRLFCSGLTDEMNRFKAGFFDVVDFE